jgi:hypothetical protein
MEEEVMRSDMDDMPIEAQTPDNIIDCFLDRGGEGERIIKCLAEFGFEVVRKPSPDPAEAMRAKLKLATDFLENTQDSLRIRGWGKELDELFAALKGNGEGR